MNIRAAESDLGLNSQEHSNNLGLDFQTSSCGHFFCYKQDTLQIFPPLLWKSVAQRQEVSVTINLVVGGVYTAV